MMQENCGKTRMKTSLSQDHPFLFPDFFFVGFKFSRDVRREEQVYPVGSGFLGRPKNWQQGFTKRGSD